MLSEGLRRLGPLIYLGSIEQDFLLADASHSKLEPSLPPPILSVLVLLPVVTPLLLRRAPCSTTWLLLPLAPEHRLERHPKEHTASA